MPFMPGTISDSLPLFLLILSRVAGMMLAAPVFSLVEVPPQVRALLTLAISLILTPTQIGQLPAAPNNLLDLAVFLAMEFLIGLSLGLGISILLAGLQMAGQILGLTSGMSLADVVNPNFDANLPLFSQALHMLGLAVYLVIGGHRLLFRGLLSTYFSVPPGTAAFHEDLTHTLVTLMGESMSLGIRIAAPAAVALLLATIVLGLLGRTLPQLNLLAIGLNLNSLLAVMMMVAATSTMAWAAQEMLEPTVETLTESIRALATR